MLPHSVSMQSLDFQTKGSNTLLRKFMAGSLFPTWSQSFSLFLTQLLFLLSHMLDSGFPTFLLSFSCLFGDGGCKRWLVESSVVEKTKQKNTVLFC